MPTLFRIRIPILLLILCAAQRSYFPISEAKKLHLQTISHRHVVFVGDQWPIRNLTQTAPRYVSRKSCDERRYRVVTVVRTSSFV